LLTFFTVLILVLIFVLSKTVLIVPSRSQCVKERLGKFAGVMNPGFHILVPFIERAAYSHDTREQVVDVPPQSCISRDNIQVQVDGIIYMKVIDAAQASYGIENYSFAAINLAQTTMRSELGKLTLHESLSEREKLNETVVREIDKASATWGMKVLRYEIMNIIPSQHVIHTLEKQMEAERQRRAEVVRADGDKAALTITSEGERQESINRSEGKRQEVINLAEGRASEITLLAEATAFGIRRVAEAIGKPGGKEAVKMRIVEQYLDEFGKIVQTANVTVVPSELANIKGVFEGISRVTTQMPNGV
jgi:regulator of protease activity HflC (stomatin/prohibitin superfamily)